MKRLVTNPTLEQLTEIEAKFFRGLSDPTRLKILRHLLNGEKCVSELVELLNRPQGRISNHLACLAWCGYVTARQDGRNVYYRITDERVQKILKLADGIIGDNAERITACTRI
jgi:DNA-binding transcriptional ArsR family regulator